MDGPSHRRRPDLRAAGTPRHGNGLPELRDLAPHDGVRERRLSAAGASRRRAREIRERVMAMLDTVGLGELHARPAPMLSGGQQQRVALARALVSNPEVLLLDEPLSNLDARLREEMRFELRDMQARLGITSIFVTHDQAEAMTLSDRIIVMNAGRIEQEGARRRSISDLARGSSWTSWVGPTSCRPALTRGADDGWTAVVDGNGFGVPVGGDAWGEGQEVTAGLSARRRGGAGGGARRRMGRRGALFGLRRWPCRVRGGAGRVRAEGDRSGGPAPARTSRARAAQRVAPRGARLAQRGRRRRRNGGESESRGDGRRCYRWSSERRSSS